ncbi:calaxin-like isoform X2 [Syngnathus typhle]|uniref:calaxin-like isoform X2 n=1 Tax=Syngnathus typhle TaxID=161592 RepID=UPI002A6B07F9|nr:calaxin-like isoform X2 [Syngnathus typhle]XP_061123252.1 calaxin-like isoform X2 [Syngnathus typhle]
MSRRLIQNLAKVISKQVDHFNPTEVESLIREYYAILAQTTTTGKTTMDERKFRSILANEFGLTSNTIMERVFRTFDRDNDNIVSSKEWVEGLCVFLRGTLDEKIKYCFRVYDLSGDEYIAREEILLLVRNCLRLHGEDDPYDSIKDLVEITLKRMDHDNDDRLSFEDYKKSVKELNIVLEAFGKCLPNATMIEMFEQRIFSKKKHYRSP